MIDYKYAYLFGSLLTLLLWLILYFQRKDLRREMLTLSFATVLLAPTNILYYGKYWEPEFAVNIYNFGIESIIVCFAYGGICGVIYEYFFRKTPMKLKGVNLQISKVHLVISLIVGVQIILALEIFTTLSVMLTTALGMFGVGMLFIFFRRDLLVPSIASALIAVVVCVLVYWTILILFPEFFNRFMILDNTLGVMILGIPIEEYIWHLALGFALGVMYEVAYGKYDKKI